MALTKKLRDIADAIREKTGSTGLLTLEEMVEMIRYLDAGDGDGTYILVDEDGNEFPAVLTDELVTLTATANDVRKGTTAVTDTGVITGEKEIPAYHTTEGMVVVLTGKDFVIPDMGKGCEFTKLQALICSSSVSTEKVCIDTKVYATNSTTVLSEVTVDTANEAINLGITNDTTESYVIRYFTYKEEY